MKDDSSAHVVNMVRAKQISRMLRKKQMDNAFLWFVRKIKEKEDMVEKDKGEPRIGIGLL